MDRAGGLRLSWLWPRLGEDSPASQGGGGQYFYQDIWALEHIARNNHPCHVDVGSRLDGFVGQLTALKPVVFIDIRPRALELKSFQSVSGDLTRLPLRSGSVVSLSCLHVIEHVGLGRYGDVLNPAGTDLAAAELKRALASGGDLYVGVPVGKPRVQFNAQRILAPGQVLALFDGLQLLEFAGVDDDGKLRRDTTPDSFNHCEYACGLFHFRKTA
jgi:hypothetical protein